MPTRPGDPNPFAGPTTTKSVTLTFRVTPEQHAAIVATVGNKRGAIKNLIHEGLGLAIERHQRARERKR